MIRKGSWPGWALAIIMTVVMVALSLGLWLLHWR